MTKLQLSTSQNHYFLRMAIRNEDSTGKAMDELLYAILRIAQTLFPQNYVELHELQKIMQDVLGIMDDYIRYESHDDVSVAMDIFSSRKVIGLLSDIKRKLSPLIVPEPLIDANPKNGEIKWHALSDIGNPFMAALYEKSLSNEQKSASIYRFLKDRKNGASYPVWVESSMARRQLIDRVLPQMESLGLNARFMKSLESFEDDDFLSPWVAYRLLAFLGIQDLIMDGVFLVRKLKSLRRKSWDCLQWAQVFPEIDTNTLPFILCRAQFLTPVKTDKKLHFRLKKLFYTHMDTVLYGRRRNLIDLEDAMINDHSPRMTSQEFGQMLLQKGLGMKAKKLSSMEGLLRELRINQPLEESLFAERVRESARSQLKQMDPDGIFMEGYLERLDQSMHDAFSCLEAAVMPNGHAVEELKEAIDCLSMEKGEF